MLFRNRTTAWRSESFSKAVERAAAAQHTNITQHHHVHFKFKHIYAVMNLEERIKVSRYFGIPDDVNQAMATGILVWMMASDEATIAKVKRTGLFNVRTVAEYKNIAKELSVEAKSLQNLLPVDLRQVFELDVLVNRVSGTPDWEKEKVSRSQPDAAAVPDDFIYTTATKIFRDAYNEGKRPATLQWKDYWKTRWEWVAAGSIHTQYKSDAQYIVRKPNECKNKFLTVVNMPTMPIERFLTRTPEIQAWASTKYEWAKQRAIYGTDLTSYVLANFAFYKCENLLPAQFPVGKDANAENVALRVRGVLRYGLPLCVDFEDFNSQHSAQAMSTVMDAFQNVYHRHLSDEQLAAMNWTRASIERQTVTDNIGLKTVYQAQGTLMSGWRLTTFMNSVLNYVYVQYMQKDSASKLPAVHNGDDVLAATSNMDHARRMFKAAIDANIRVQPTKCAFGGIAEFLRIDHVRGARGQYLSRAVATFVHSRVESRPNPNVKDLVEAMENRFADLASRGMQLELISRLREVYYTRLQKYRQVSVSDCYIIKTTHRVAGGMSEEADASVQPEVVLTQRDELLTESQRVVQRLPLPGVYDFSEYVKNALDLTHPLGVFIKRVRRATERAVDTSHKKLEILKTEGERRRLNIRMIYKAHEGEFNSSSYGKAVLTGFSLEILGKQMRPGVLKAMLERDPDPVGLLGLVA
uniref:RNA-directed RNA polymerase n=1 Tax=Erysiphales associated totivirus 22 TaxID=2719852 RepID=A0A6G9ELM1_9VIRU|nr:RNA-dependent RNA polymerase [Erysiphales associated totivirus 22]